jgi:hypothetical protein
LCNIITHRAWINEFAPPYNPGLGTYRNPNREWFLCIGAETSHQPISKQKMNHGNPTTLTFC